MDQPATYDLRLFRCGDDEAIRVFSPDGSTVFASATGVGASCAALSFPFTGPGTYPVQVLYTNDAGCDPDYIGGGPATFFWESPAH